MVKLTELDRLLLDRWQDMIGLQDGFEELQDRLARRLDGLVRALEPWAAAQGYSLDLDKKHAEVLLTKETWRDAVGSPRVSLTVGGLYPYGYRRVVSEHPYLWIYTPSLNDGAVEAFKENLSVLLGPDLLGWTHDECDDDGPFGRYIETHTDVERAALASDDEALRSFVQTQATVLMALGPHIETALLSPR
jgi:hypothetical protein